MPSTVIALGWERGHDYRSCRQAAYKPVVELNISSSEQTSALPLWSKSGSDIFRQHSHGAFITCSLHTSKCGHTPTHISHTLTQEHTQRGSYHKRLVLCIDPDSTGCSCTFVPFVKLFKRRAEL